MKKLIGVLSAVALSVATLATPASAAIQNYQESPADFYTEPGTPSNFDLVSVSYAEFTEAPDFHFFYLDFASPVIADQFNDGQGSWAMIMIDVNGDNQEDFRIETRAETLQESYGSPAFVYDKNREQEVTGCSAVFYGNLEDSARWIGFKIPYNCLKLPRTFGIQGYSDYLEDDEFYYDYAPDDSFFRISHKLSPSNTSRNLPAPSIANEALYSVPSPGSAPADLVALSPKVLKSVVTVFCGEGLGTGWAAKVAIPSSVTSQGLRTYIVTNYHVIEDCVFGGEVTITDESGNSAVGYIATVDSTNDLAGIYTRMALPTLSFRGERPAQGWWVGVLGSPRGLDGYLTTGLVSKVVSDGAELGVSASLNPGNSGGPIFDREGRVLGVATWKILESEGLGFARSSPLLCSTVVKCDSANPVWSTQLAARPGTGGSSGGTQVGQVKSALLPQFAARSSRMTATQQNSVNRLLILNGWATKFICTGVVARNASSAERSLARLRAKAACDYAKRLNPSLSTFFQTKVSTSRNSIGRVLVTIKG